MSAARQLIEALNKYSKNKFWDNTPNNPTFQEVLDRYAKYSERDSLEKIFWEQIKEIGTPIIEDDLQNEGKCHVYFLFPKNNLSASTENITTNKDLYLQGDFHGFGATDGRQKLEEYPHTGIMLLKDSMPKNAIVMYQYIEVEPQFRGIKPEPELPPFFNNEGLSPCQTNEPKFPPIPSNVCIDKNSKHTFPYPGFDSGQRIFRVNADSERAYIPGERINWLNVFNINTLSYLRHFVCQAVLYSDKNGDLHGGLPVSDQYHDDLYFSDKRMNSPYSEFTRAIQIFKPAASNIIEDVIVINDGSLYLIAGLLNRFEKMVDDETLSPNTAFVFINPLPGLRAVLSKETGEEYDNDPSVKAPGMGIRLADYKHGIDEYVDFIRVKLFPQLKKIINVPDDPKHRLMIGSSISGTATIYIASFPELFGRVIAQSPSPDNRGILSKRAKEILKANSRIYLSCGEFENPKKAAANDNLGYAKELSNKLGLQPDIQFFIGPHGHTCVPWREEIAKLLPQAISSQLNRKNEKIESIMNDASIPATQIALGDFSDNTILTNQIGVIDFNQNEKVTKNTQFGAASLSKPVFAYLVLKLIQSNQYYGFDLKTNLNDILPFEKFCKKYNLKWKASKTEKKWVELLTPENILSYTTGFADAPDLFFRFKPGEAYRYAGLPLLYLQEVLKEKTNLSLEELARRFVFLPLKMTHSTFAHINGPKESAANSLFTTAHDYVKFVIAWMNDKSLQYALRPIMHMIKKNGESNDSWASSQDVLLQDMKYLATGIGWDLEKDEEGNVTKIYKTGDMNQWRAQVAVDLNTKKIIVFFSNSPHGHLLSDQIIAPHVELTQGLNCFYKKYGFVRSINPELKLCDIRSRERVKDVIYIDTKEKGIELEMLGDDNCLKKRFCPWEWLPKKFPFNEDFPHKLEEILKMDNKFLPTLLYEQFQISKVDKFVVTEKNPHLLNKTEGASLKNLSLLSQNKTSVEKVEKNFKKPPSFK